MKAATVNEIDRDFLAVLKWVQSGEVVEVMQEGKPVAVISPLPRKVQHPDYLARLKQAFGSKVIPNQESETIRELMRGEK